MRARVTAKQAQLPRRTAGEVNNTTIKSKKLRASFSIGGGGGKCIEKRKAPKQFHSTHHPPACRFCFQTNEPSSGLRFSPQIDKQPVALWQSTKRPTDEFVEIECVDKETSADVVVVRFEQRNPNFISTSCPFHSLSRLSPGGALGLTTDQTI